jgi:hypothetical protein
VSTFEGIAEIVLRVRRADGSWSVRSIWVVVVDQDVYVRSAFGRRGAWYRAVRAGAPAEIETARAILPVRLEPVHDPAVHRRVSDGYRVKYGLSWPGPVETMLTDEACATTMRLHVGDAGSLDGQAVPGSSEIARNPPASSLDRRQIPELPA